MDRVGIRTSFTRPPPLLLSPPPPPPPLLLPPIAFLLVPPRVLANSFCLAFPHTPSPFYLHSVQPSLQISRTQNWFKLPSAIYKSVRRGGGGEGRETYREVFLVGKGVLHRREIHITRIPSFLGELRAMPCAMECSIERAAFFPETFGINSNYVNTRGIYVLSRPSSVLSRTRGQYTMSYNKTIPRWFFFRLFGFIILNTLTKIGQFLCVYGGNIGVLY